MEFGYTRNDLENGPLGKEIRDKIKKQFPSFKKSEMPKMIDWLLENGYITIEEEIKSNSSGRPKQIIKKVEKKTTEKVPF